MKTILENANSFDGCYWAKVCEDIKVDHRDGTNDRFRRKAVRAAKLWRKETFRAFYSLKFHAKRKVVRRVIRKDLSAGLWCRHTAQDNIFNVGYVPKMSGFSVRSVFDDVINVDAEISATMPIPQLEQYEGMRISTESRPYQRERRRTVTVPIWRNGQRDSVEDIRFDVEWIERTVKVAAFSSSVNFDYSFTDETEKLGKAEDSPTRKAFREASCERWIEPRLSRILPDGSGGELLPQNSLAVCDNGNKIPSLDIENWKLGIDGYVLDSVPRYVLKSVLSAFRLNLQGGNASNNGGLRPQYTGKQRGDIRHEFVQECLQEIALAHLECLRNVRKFTGILCGALSRIITRFVRQYCSGGSNRDRQATIERTRKNANALAKKLAEFSGLQFPTDEAEKFCKMLTTGLTQTEIGETEKVSQSKVSRVVKETIAFNRILAGFDADLASDD